MSPVTPPTVIDMIRHGEPRGGRRYRGRLDDPLSDKGWQQMWATVADPPPWEQIISSPMARCREFAHSLGEKLAIPVTQDERLREVGFGAWEGKTAAEIKRRDPGVIARFYADPVNNRPRGAEPLDAFSQRVNRAFADALSNYAGRHILIVAHAGVIRAVIARLVDAPPGAMYRIAVENAALIRVRADGERPPTLVFGGPAPGPQIPPGEPEN